MPTNLIPNGDFGAGRLGELPDGWRLNAPYDFLRPSFKLVERDGRKVLEAGGAGNPDCIGWLSSEVHLTAGRTYLLSVRFRVSRDLDPNTSLLFAFYQDGFNDGVFRLERLRGGWIRGEGRFPVPGEGEMAGEARIYFRYSADGAVWVSEISLVECDPIPTRPVKVACCSGTGDLASWGAVLDYAGKERADIALITETFNGTNPELADGPSATLMASKAREHGIYVAGTFIYHDPDANRHYNAGSIYDRKGHLVGKYYKNHPYSPEAFSGVTPGTEVPVFETDFGKVGMITCYDSWFTDVTELLALKGAEIVLFPSAGFYRELMHARAADNCVRIVASSANTGCGIWDTAGTEIARPDSDQTRYPNCEGTFSGVKTETVGEISVLTATLDLSKSPSPHNWGGPMMSAPGGRRNRRDQKRLLYRDIEREVRRWWER